MKVVSTFLAGMEIKVATVVPKKGLLTKSNAELLSLTARKVARSAHTETSFIGTISSIYFGFNFHVAISVLLYCGRDFSKCFLTLELQRS